MKEANGEEDERREGEDGDGLKKYCTVKYTCERDVRTQKGN